MTGTDRNTTTATKQCNSQQNATWIYVKVKVFAFTTTATA